MTDLLVTAGFIALGFLFGWQCRDHAQLEKEWRARDALALAAPSNIQVSNARQSVPPTL